MRWLTALALIVFMATACTGAAGQRSAALSTPSPSYVPWLPLPASGVYLVPPKPSPTPVPAGAYPCSVGQLEATLFGQFGYTGHTDTLIVFRNRGGTPCTIEGYPDLTIFDASGRVISQVVGSGQYASFFDSPVVSVVLETDTPPLTTTQQIRQALPPGQAQLDVEWYDCRAPVAARMTIDLPDRGGRLSVDYAVNAPGSPVCDKSGGGTPVAFLGRGPFRPSWVQPPPARPTSLSPSTSPGRRR